jgi:hypothetical protein
MGYIYIFKPFDVLVRMESRKPRRKDVERKISAMDILYAE